MFCCRMDVLHAVHFYFILRDKCQPWLVQPIYILNSNSLDPWHAALNGQAQVPTTKRKTVQQAIYAKSWQTACRTTVTRYRKPDIMWKTKLFHMVTHCSCNFSSGVLIETIGNIGTLGTFTGELLGNLTLGTLPWDPYLGNYLGTFTWELGNLGNLYLGTTWEPLLGNLGNLYLGTFTWYLETFTWYLGTLPWEPYLGNYLGTFTWYLGTLPWEPLLGNLGNLYLGTLPWELLGNLYLVLGNLYLGTTTWEPLLGNLGTLGTSTWEPYLGNYLGTFTWEPWEPLLGNLYLGTLGPLGEWVLELLLGNLGNLGGMGLVLELLLGNLYLGTLGTLGTLGEWVLELLLGNLYLGTLGTLGEWVVELLRPAPKSLLWLKTPKLLLLGKNCCTTLMEPAGLVGVERKSKTRVGDSSEMCATRYWVACWGTCCCCCATCWTGTCWGCPWALPESALDPVCTVRTLFQQSRA